MARRREKGPWFWRGAIGAMLASVFGLFAVMAFNAPPGLDMETACRLDHKDPAHTVLLIDQSDPFNPNDLDWVYALVDAEARTLPRFGRLTVMTPNAADPFDPKVIYMACSPGSVEDANPVFQNPRMIDDIWRDTFYTPLKEKIEQAMLETRQPSSPLLEAVYSIADRADFQRTKKPRKIVMVSDLMQHSEAMSFYRSGAGFDKLAETKLAERMPDMQGVEVAARIVPRQEYDLPMSEVKAFWRAYFDQTGADFGSVN